MNKCVFTVCKVFSKYTQRGKGGMWMVVGLRIYIASYIGLNVQGCGLM